MKSDFSNISPNPPHLALLKSSASSYWGRFLLTPLLDPLLLLPGSVSSPDCFSPSILVSARIHLYGITSFHNSLLQRGRLTAIIHPSVIKLEGFLPWTKWFLLILLSQLLFLVMNSTDLHNSECPGYCPPMPTGSDNAFYTMPTARFLSVHEHDRCREKRAEYFSTDSRLLHLLAVGPPSNYFIYLINSKLCFRQRFLRD